MNRIVGLTLVTSLFLSVSILAALQLRNNSTLAEYDLASTEVLRRPLPPPLSEISGMATTGDGRTLAHADERAVVTEIDVSTGQVRKSFGFGTPVEPGDFEGIAVAQGRIYLVTSAGVIYSAEEGKANGTVVFQRFESGAGQFCEIEGLAYDAVGDRLLLPCKQTRRREWRDRVLVLGVPLRTMKVERMAALSLPQRELKSGLGGVTPNLTSIEVHPRTGSWLLLSSSPSAVIEVAPNGTLLGIVRLPQQIHPQPESITFTRDLTLLIADEARGGTAHIAVYPRRR
jgi:uncharacterized protein YjiK